MSIRAPMTPRAGLLWLVALLLASALAFWDITHRSPRPRPSEAAAPEPASHAQPTEEDWVDIELEGTPSSQ